MAVLDPYCQDLRLIFCQYKFLYASINKFDTLHCKCIWLSVKSHNYKISSQSTNSQTYLEKKTEQAHEHVHVINITIISQHNQLTSSSLKSLSRPCRITTLVGSSCRLSCHFLSSSRYLLRDGSLSSQSLSRSLRSRCL